MIRADLHMHTTASDGALEVEKLIKKAKKSRLDIISITDHDTVNSVKTALSLQSKYNIKVIPGIELTTKFNNESIHLLGYFKDDSFLDNDFLYFLEYIKQERYERGKKIVEGLKVHFNIDINFDNLIKNSKGTLARPHIAKAIQDLGYDKNFSRIFDLYLSKESPAYVPNNSVSLEKGLKILKKYNALRILAHPVLIKKTPLNSFLSLDIEGIEADYPLNKGGDLELYIDICRENNLIYTAGSDYHGIDGDKKHGDLGQCTLNSEPLDRFLQALNI
ncbi:PHP domain-containing protein [Hathewaya histolytica]|uniref:Putative metal-dependent phosphoesterase, PHP family n=1 Tax=Hathewaya histolytica TaxID=1498 RepID=A0A4U9R746_HATHI|nr:PHP domain-containing protein [Hathewaya histolytica]VTQ87312.1 putative metal-dependent phosphoesterase, PHP family [Hathewaya histolytica]